MPFLITYPVSEKVIGLLTLPKIMMGRCESVSVIGLDGCLNNKCRLDSSALNNAVVVIKIDKSNAYKSR